MKTPTLRMVQVLCLIGFFAGPLQVLCLDNIPLDMSENSSAVDSVSASASLLPPLWTEQRPKSLATTTLFSIKTCHGVPIDDISVIPDEKEVLIPPYETFVVRRKDNVSPIRLESDGVYSRFNCERLQDRRKNGPEPILSTIWRPQRDSKTKLTKGSGPGEEKRRERREEKRREEEEKRREEKRREEKRRGGEGRGRGGEEGKTIKNR
ncbi:NADP -arginine ADP-ribosyltransferase 2-like [Crotalus adamanteus]|uniref:NAD(P)(+)--arginine ADP-ribosyltransferase n=1 Tax=Crotalus adamanteus TaxID=8729 RepID=A0AAW1B1Y4_CROAD